MKNSIEIQNEELIISKFSIENITDNKESFYKVINDIYLKYKNNGTVFLLRKDT